MTEPTPAGDVGREGSTAQSGEACGRCGFADSSVLDLDTGGRYHASLWACIQLLRADRDALRGQVEALLSGESDNPTHLEPLYTLSAAREILAGELRAEANRLRRMALQHEKAALAPLWIREAKHFDRSATWLTRGAESAAAFVRQGGRDV